jgi:hypothetical protein
VSSRTVLVVSYLSVEDSRDFICTCLAGASKMSVCTNLTPNPDPAVLDNARYQPGGVIEGVCSTRGMQHEETRREWTAERMTGGSQIQVLRCDLVFMVCSKASLSSPKEKYATSTQHPTPTRSSSSLPIEYPHSM